jgi:hypothetical protein
LAGKIEFVDYVEACNLAKIGGADPLEDFRDLRAARRSMTTK